MVLTEAAGDAELVLWDGREFGHWWELKPALGIAIAHTLKDHSLSLGYACRGHLFPVNPHC